MASFALEEGEEADLGGFRIRREKGRIRTDRTGVYPSFEGAHLISGNAGDHGKTHLEVLVDRHLIEVYVNDGEYVISNAVYGPGQRDLLQGPGADPGCTPQKIKN